MISLGHLGRALAFGANIAYRTGDTAVYCPQAKAATSLMLKIESRKGVENAEAMMANEWVDAIGAICTANAVRWDSDAH